MQLSERPLLQLTQYAVNPFVTVGILVILTRYHAVPFTKQYLLLAVLSFLLAMHLLEGVALELNFRQFCGLNLSLIIIRWTMFVMLLGLIGYTTKTLDNFDVGLLWNWIILTPFVLAVIQVVIRTLLYRFYSESRNQIKTVVVGVNDLSLKLMKRLENQQFLGVDCLGFFDDRDIKRLQIERSPLGKLKDVARFVKEHHVKIIYVALPMTAQTRIGDLLNELRDTTMSIYYLPDVFMYDLIQARILNIHGIPLVALCETPFIGINAIVKRFWDVMLASLILVVLSPLLVLISLGIKLTSPGPVLFLQRRYGLDGEEIIVYKFRSMTVCENGPDIAQAKRKDPRVTRFGAFLRKSSLDELPQFLNVLQGSMSIVGPRPHAVAHNELYRNQINGYMIRHKVKPGITGWAQVNGSRGETDTIDKMQERIKFDLDYLRNWSLALDFLIILRTVGVVIKGENAY